jgi:hypothetical protein
MMSGRDLWWRYADEFMSSLEDDVIVVSYPKAGRTWHRVTFGKYLALLSGKPLPSKLKSRKMTRALGLPRVSYSHNGANFENAIGPRHLLNAWSPLWRWHKIILLVREPKDVMVSGYHHARYRSRSFTGSLSEYLRHPFTGIEKLLVAHQRWYRYRDYTRGFLLQRYETTHEDPENSLRAALEFMKIPIDEEALRGAVEFATFDNMRKLEQEGAFVSHAMRSEDTAGESARKVRKGRVGGYVEHMSSDDVRYVDEMIERIGYPFQC